MRAGRAQQHHHTLAVLLVQTEHREVTWCCAISPTQEHCPRDWTEDPAGLKSGSCLQREAPGGAAAWLWCLAHPPGHGGLLKNVLGAFRFTAPRPSATGHSVGSLTRARQRVGNLMSNMLLPSRSSPTTTTSPGFQSRLQAKLCKASQHAPRRPCTSWLLSLSLHHTGLPRGPVPSW